MAFRNRTADEIRDIYVSRLVDGRWTEPAAVHNDNWKIAACPVNGPALSARGESVVIAWFTGVHDQDQVFAAFSRDSGKNFSAPTKVHDEGAVGSVDVELLENGSAVVSWIEFAQQRSQFRIRRVDASGTSFPSSSVTSIAQVERVATRDSRDMVMSFCLLGPTLRPEHKCERRLPFYGHQRERSQSSWPVNRTNSLDAL